ncbi:MAG TPA: 4a-hydroxytetrahydrobiopterin dehydratase [Hydrogenophaga sp.]|uniref:4a-hydroxytetrahydrobiopterin dehydratase n=1 Tax=Hydrogenophaga sp. TaxID=1904254 RepID=UPI002C70DDAC|nr:4a-hydroxytetrahydrobiopterin dehydratase [Hydrogenophaga sp.]HMN93111.1 4a-hydroxytetrahydrobiopterin dehydratase [Hydrogenophaga sp.]HMP10931.1 4a-hydroxytetrahydrobiopterin dehydratase [Hydrogenophaga sp.]
MNPIHHNRRALSPTEIVTQLTQLNGDQPDGWTLIDGALEKEFRFANFHETIGFVNALAWVANREDHHPDLSVSYNRCVVRFNTHDVNGISVSDFYCAAAVDVLTGS